MDLKELIRQEITAFVAAENRKYCEARSKADGLWHCEACRESAGDSAHRRAQVRDGLWQEPLVGFADANSGYIDSLKTIVHPNHQMPREVLEDASIVITYFVPFENWLPATNLRDRQIAGAKGRKMEGVKGWKETDAGGGRCEASANLDTPQGGDAPDLASPEWAESYELTNAMFTRLNEHIIHAVHKLGYEAKTAPEAGVFHRDEVISYWSFRHFGYAAGLGTFGLNNMLITEKGCCGRLNTVVTNLDVMPDTPKQEEACLYKRNGTCGLCSMKCPSEALCGDEADSQSNASLYGRFDRHKCFDQCLKNAAIYNDFGSSYASNVGEEADAGSEVCGKCIAGMPCAHRIP